MKKTLALILTLCTLLCAMTACHSRREEYKPKDTTAETQSESTPAGNDGTKPSNPVESDPLTEETQESGQDTEQGRDDPFDPNADHIGVGNPYAGMTPDELVQLYWDHYFACYTQSSVVVNTPYYMILSTDGGGNAYSKLTGEFVKL